MKGIDSDILKQLTFNQRIALWVTVHVGTMGAVYVILAFYLSWMGTNIILGKKAFDAPPNFLLLLFISNFIQVLWQPLITVGQNILSQVQELQGKRDRQRDEADYQLEIVEEHELIQLAANVERIEKKLDMLLSFKESAAAQPQDEETHKLY